MPSNRKIRLKTIFNLIIKLAYTRGVEGISGVLTKVNVKLRRVMGVEYHSSDNSISCFLIPARASQMLIDITASLMNLQLFWMKLK